MPKQAWVMLIVLLTAGTARAAPKAGPGPAERKARAAIAKHYKDPIIERQDCPFPGVLYFSAFERANLVEDPIVPRRWYVTPDGRLHDDFPLDAVHHQPADRQEARKLATWLFQTRYRWSRNLQAVVSSEKKGRRFVIKIDATVNMSHPMFGARDARQVSAVVRVEDGAWSMSASDPLTPVSSPH